MNVASVESTPVAVTVFRDRARVTRLAHVAVEQGRRQVEITGLPLALVGDSVRVSGRGTAAARLVGVSTRLQQFAEAPADAVQALERQVEAAEDADASLAARVRLLEAGDTQLGALASESSVLARGLALRDQPTERAGAILDFVGARRTAIALELAEVAAQRREGARELDRLRRELEALRSSRQPQRHVVSVELDVTTAGDLDLELVHLVTGASWEPLYDARLTPDGLTIGYLAEISQSTGEDWPAVALAVSTASPATTLVVPELDPWYVRVQRPTPPPMPMPPPARSGRGIQLAGAAAPMAADMVMPPMAPVPPELDLAVETAVVELVGASVTYRLGGHADVPGNGDPRKVAIGDVPLRPRIDYVTAPLLAEACFRRAKVRNESEYTLLPGRVQVFDGYEYLGATRIDQVAPGAELELFLGPDDRMPVERELAAREADRTFIGDRRRVRYGYTIELENLVGSTQTVTVRDQFPVARDEQIKVRLESVDPKPTKQTELNLLEWELSLEPGEKRTIRLDFSVESPRSVVVLGLPE